MATTVATSGIQKTLGVCGGDACIRDTRIMVWLLVDLKRQGMSNAKILAGYPSLSEDDLAAAWEYYVTHPREIDEAIETQESDEEDQP